MVAPTSLPASVNYSDWFRAAEVVQTPLQLVALIAIICAAVIAILAFKISAKSAAIVACVFLAILSAALFFVIGPLAAAPPLRCDTPKTQQPTSGTDVSFQPSPCDRLLNFKADAPFRNICGGFRGVHTFRAEVLYRDTNGTRLEPIFSGSDYGASQHAIIEGSVMLPKNTGGWITFTQKGDACAILNGTPKIDVWLTDK